MRSVLRIDLMSLSSLFSIASRSSSLEDFAFSNFSMLLFTFRRNFVGSCVLSVSSALKSNSWSVVCDIWCWFLALRNVKPEAFFS